MTKEHTHTSRKVTIRHKDRGPRRSCLHWSASEIQTLMNLFEAGKSMDVITEKLNRTESAIRGKMTRLGLRCQPNKSVVRQLPWTDEEDATLVQEWHSGTPVETIAKKISRTNVAIRKRRKKLQLPVRFMKCVDGQIIQQKYDTGVSIHELANEFSISTYAVKMALLARRHSEYHLVSDDEREIIEERYKDGCTSKCIARRIRKSLRTVDKYITEADLRNTPQFHDDLVQELTQHNLSVDQIAAKLELPRYSILHALKRIGRADYV